MITNVVHGHHFVTVQVISLYIKGMYPFMMILAWTKSLRFHYAPGLGLLANQQGSDPLFGKRIGRSFMDYLFLLVDPGYC